MNTFKNFKQVLLVALSLLIVQSCVKDDDYSIPELPCGEQTVTMTLHELVALVDADTDGIVFFDQTESVVVEGYVVSSDEQGNFFKTVSIQDKLVDPTIGVQVEMDITNLFRKFPIGHKIQIKLNGIYAGFDRGIIKIGETYLSGSETRVGRMSALKVPEHVQVTCDFDAVTPVEFNSIGAALANGKLNTLIKINNVQFVQTGVPYSQSDATTDRSIIDANGTTLVVRNSNFATFAGTTMPEGSGSITVVLSQYNALFQSYIRDTNDVVFDQPRFEVSDGAGPVGGESASYDACLTEGFESYTVDASSFPSYINFAYNGNRYWQIKSFDGNKYIQMSAFNSTNAVNTSYFIVPVDFSSADSFSFKTKDGFNNGAALKVYYTTNYAIGGTFSPSSLVDITSSFTISSGNVNGYGNNFINSGDYSLTSLSGNGAIVFKYEGSNGGITTTMQIDDIKITDNENPSCN